MKLKITCIALILLTCAMLMMVIFQSNVIVGTKTEPHSVILRMAVANAENHPNALTAEKFSEMVKERSNGKIIIEVYPDSFLGTQESTVEQLKFGGIDFAITESHVLSENMLKVEKFEKSYIDRVSGEERIAKTGEVRPIKDALDVWNLEVLASFTPDYRCIANNSRNIYTNQKVDDLTIQLSGTFVLGDMLSTRGFKVVYQEDMDILKSLRNDYIDGAEMSFLNYIYNDYGDSMPYITLLAGPEIPDVLLASTASMGTMSVEDQNLIRECARDAEIYQQELLVRSLRESCNYLRNNEIYMFPFETQNMLPEEWEILWHKFICHELEVAG